MMDNVDKQLAAHDERVVALLEESLRADDKLMLDWEEADQATARASNERACALQRAIDLVDPIDCDEAPRDLTPPRVPARRRPSRRWRSVSRSGARLDIDNNDPLHAQGRRDRRRRRQHPMVAHDQRRHPPRAPGLIDYS